MLLTFGVFAFSQDICSLFAHTTPYYIQSRILSMSTIAWKCYRCDLTFKYESHVVLHKDITKHSVREVEITA